MLRIFLVSLALVGSVLSLRVEDAKEGSCHGIHYDADSHVDLDFLETLHYVPAANRYHLYRTASGHPRFSEMREFELYYNMCFMRNASYGYGRGSAMGFGGRTLINYNLGSRKGLPADTVEWIPSDGSGDRLQQTVTLTDHKTFAFVANCWTGTDQRSFDVFARSPELSSSTRRLIEQHAISLGFSKREIVFLSYKSCGQDPLPDRRVMPTVGKRASVSPLPGNKHVKRAPTTTTTRPTTGGAGWGMTSSTTTTRRPTTTGGPGWGMPPSTTTTTTTTTRRPTTGGPGWGAAPSTTTTTQRPTTAGWGRPSSTTTTTTTTQRPTTGWGRVY